jgi:hypothetical protein
MADMELDGGAGMEVEVPLEGEEADMINQVSVLSTHVRTPPPR